MTLVEARFSSLLFHAYDKVLFCSERILEVFSAGVQSSSMRQEVEACVRGWGVDHIMVWWWWQSWVVCELFGGLAPRRCWASPALALLGDLYQVPGSA